MGDYFSLLMAGFGVTIGVTFGTFAIALVAAVPITLMCRSRLRLLRFIGTAYVEVFRGIPPLTLVFLAFFALPELNVSLQPIPAAIVGLSLMATAYVAEIYRGALRAVPVGQWEGASALGLGQVHVYARVIMPQASLTALPVLITYLIGLFKESTLASTIGAMDITGRAVVAARADLNGLQVFIEAAALYLVISVPVGLFGRWLQGRLGTAKVKVKA